MQAVKKKWHMLKTYRRIRKLWGEFQEVAQINDFNVVVSKLNEFLDSFATSYTDLIEQNNLQINLDKIYGDCSQILLNLLDIVEREAEKTGFKEENIVAELVSKALNVAELILHDEKYRLIVKETPNLINRILTLLDTLKTVENKKILLRVITVLAENTENKLEIGRLEGFAKILKLLLTQDSELTREILKTLKHFLDNQNNASNILASTISNNTNVSKQDAQAIVDDTKKVTSTLTEFLPERIRSVMSDVSKIVVSELNKVFTNDTKDDLDNDTYSERENLLDLEIEFIPSKDSIEETFQRLKNKHKDHPTKDIINPIITSPKLFSNSVDLDKNKIKTTVLVSNNNNNNNGNVNSGSVNSGGNSTTEEEILKEFMRVQGALSTLTNTLQEAALTVQLDLVETISQLIFKNQENQNEFKKIDGYSFFTRLFDKIHDFSTSKESRLFLEDCFSILFAITLDGNKSRRVGNLDALEFLFQICMISDQLDVKYQAIRCIQDILSIHPLNVVDVLFVGGVDTLFTLLLQFNSIPNENDIKQHEFILNVSNVLNYIGILLSSYDNLVLEKYLNAIDIYIVQKNITLKSVSLLLYSTLNLISDCIYHKCPISLHSSTSVLNLLNNLSSSSSSPTTSKESTTLNNEGIDFFSVDVILQSLEVIGILVKDSNHFKHFKEIKGFEILTGLIVKYATDSRDIIELSLWILQQLVAVDTSSTIYYFNLLHDISLPVQFRSIVCYSLAELLYKSNDNVHQSIRQLCKELGILDILFTLSKEADINEDKEFLLSILYLLGELASSSVDTQIYLHDHIGISNILYLIRSVPLDVNLFVMILEMTTIPNLRDCLNFDPEYNKKNHSKLVLPRIANILTPKALHTKPVECSRNPLESLTLSSLSLSLKERNLNNDANTSSSSSRRSSFSNDEEDVEQDVGEDDVNVDTYLSNPHIEESDSRDDMVVEYDSNRNSFIVEYSTKRNLDTNSYYLNRVQIRSKDSALFILEVLSIFNQNSSSSAQSQIEVLNILLKLLEANPKNKSIFCSVQAVKYLLNLASQCSEELSSVYFQLVACIGSYDISPSEVRILFDLASLSLANINEEDKIKREKGLQMELLNVISNITERKSPLSYFHFNGFDDYFEIKLDRFPRNTYSIAFWCKIEHFIYDGSPIFTFKDNSNRSIMSVYFKQEKSNKESNMRHYLCVETQTHPYPPEKVILEEYSFVEGSPWRHIVFSHSKQKFEFFMDGEIVQSASINYPTTLTKEKINSLIVGKRSITNQNNRVSTNIYFSGYLGTIHLYDGVLDELQSTKLFSYGHNTMTIPKLDIKEWLVINPLSYYNEIVSNSMVSSTTTTTTTATVPSTSSSAAIYNASTSSISNTNDSSTAATTTTATPGILHTSIGNLLLNSNVNALSLTSDTLPSPKKDKTASEIYETHYAYNGMSIHYCKSLKDVIKGVGGVQLCFPFLTMGSTQHLNIGLRIITSILQQSSQNMKLFKDMQGFSILYTLLKQSKDILSLETFEILIDLCCDGILLRSKKKYIQHKESLCLALDLLLEDIDVALQSNVLSFLIDFIISVPENISVLTSKEDPLMGIPYLLNFISKLQADSNVVLSLISKLISTMSIDDLECIFDFIIWEKDKLFEVTLNLLNLFYSEIQKSPVLLDYFVKLGAFQIIFSIIESPSEDIRILGLKLLGLVLTSQRNKKLFFSINGFDLLCSLLSEYPTSNLLSSTLFQLSLGKFNSIEEKKSTWMDLFTATTTTNAVGTTSPANESSTSVQNNVSLSSKEVTSIYHTECIHVLMELLKLTKDWDLHVHVIMELMKCLDNKNMELLWSSPYLEWTVEYYQSVRSEGDEKVLLHLRRFLQKMFLYDISRKTSNISKLKDMVEHEPFQIEVIECILDYLEEHPVLTPSSTDATTVNDIVLNISNLFKYVEDIQLTPQVCKRIIDSINTLAYHNTAVSRSYMKKYALFDLRDNLILRILRGSSNLSEFTTQEEEEESDNSDILNNTSSSTNLVNMSNSSLEDYYLSETTVDFILNFSFESIADQKAFRDTNNGLLYLLNLLFISKNIPSIQLTLYDILRNIFGTIDENKKVLCSIFEDQEIIIRFFESPEIPNKQDYLNDIILDASNSPSKLTNADGTNTITKLQSTITFLDWFYSDMAITKRSELEAKVKKLLTQPEAKFKAFMKTVNQRQVKKLKLRKEKLAKTLTAANKALSEYEEKRKHKIQKSHLNAQQSLKFVEAARMARLNENKKGVDQPKETL